jgi:hypothetical protein
MLQPERQPNSFEFATYFPFTFSSGPTRRRILSVATGSRSKIPVCSTTRVKSAIVFSLMVDGSRSLGCRIFGRLWPVRIVTKRDAIAIKARTERAGK